MEIGRKIIHLNSVDSTSNYTANLIKKGEIDHGTVIMADDQFSGRGQRDAKWLVKSGENLTFSVFVDNVNLSVDEQFYINEMVSLILVRFLEKLGLKSKIKWPNDIYVNGKKIAGVLIENQIAGSTIKSCIIGIGININQIEFEGFTATSTYLDDGILRKLKEALFVFIHTFNSFWKDFSDENRKQTRSDYLEKIYRLNEVAEFEDKSGKFFGQITDVLNSGELVIEREGLIKSYNLKEIIFLH